MRGMWHPDFAVPLLAALLAVLTLASSAWAECAWVLWNEVTTTRMSTLAASREWVIVYAGSGKPECERQQTAKMSSFPNKVKGVDNIATDSIGPGVTITYRLVCLPDTVEPRAPKASGR